MNFKSIHYTKSILIVLLDDDILTYIILSIIQFICILESQVLECSMGAFIHKEKSL